DRIRQMIIQPRLDLAHELAKAQHDAKLIGLDAEEAGKSPQRDGNKRNERDAAAAEIARHQATQLVLAAAQEVFEIGRPRPPGRLRPRAPRSPRPGTPRAAGLVVPRHQLSPRTPALRRHALWGLIGERAAPYNAQL